ncbi:MAG: hypothetical protein FWF18_01825 [Dehalococcoidia bacterium]|nr:hypothetical protein [Dehalococcoidia bacterium]
MKKLKLIALLSLVVFTPVVMVACKNNAGDEWNNYRNHPGLSNELQKQIVADCFRNIDNTYGNYKLEDFYIAKYYGTYNASVAVIMGGLIGPPSVPPPYEVAGFVFQHSTWETIIIWNSGILYELVIAYDEGLLTIADIEALHNIHTA